MNGDGLVNSDLQESTSLYMPQRNTIFIKFSMHRLTDQ